MQLALRTLLEPLGFAETQAGSFLRVSSDQHVRHLVAPFRYPSGRVTVEVGFLCPELTSLAVPELALYDPPDVALCDAGLGFSFRLETLLQREFLEGWDEPEIAAHVDEHLVPQVHALSLRYGTLTAWRDHYDERLEAWGGALDWACWAWIQLVLGADAGGVRRAIRCFAAGGRGRFGPELARLRAAYRERYGEELSLGGAELPFEL